MSKTEIPSPSHFGEVVGYDRLDSPADSAVLELKVRPEHCNRGGTVHGGVLMTMMDTAGMWSSCAPGEASVGATVSISCNFVTGIAAAKFDTVRASAKIVRRGKNLYFTEMTIHALPGDKLAATGQAVYALPR